MRQYKELIMEIEMHKKLRDSFELSLNYWLKKFNKGCPKELSCQQYSDMPKGSRDDTTLDVIFYNINHFKSLIHTETEIIDSLQKNLDIINENIRNSNNIYDKVAYLKYQKNEYGQKKYTLAQIADMLVYSEDRIKQISAQV